MISATHGSKIKIIEFNKYLICRVHYWSHDFNGGCSDSIRLFGDWEAMI